MTQILRGVYAAFKPVDLPEFVDFAAARRLRPPGDGVEADGQRTAE